MSNDVRHQATFCSGDLQAEASQAEAQRWCYVLDGDGRRRRAIGGFVAVIVGGLVAAVTGPQATDQTAVGILAFLALQAGVSTLWSP